MESESASSNSLKPTTTAILLLVIGILVGLLIGLNLPSILSPPQQTDDEPSLIRVEGVSADDDPFLGSPDAPVTIIEFSDFQCPFCRRFFENTLQEIKRNYVDTGKVKFVYRDFPLASMHPFAEKAAEAANCASDQDRYWQYHDLLFENQPVWAAGNATVEFKKYASTLGLDEEQFNLCLDSGKYADEISKDL
ncbi:MAG: DsbA family protein, partial [Nitrososphaerales archaeon]